MGGEGYRESVDEDGRENQKWPKYTVRSWKYQEFALPLGSVQRTGAQRPAAGLHPRNGDLESVSVAITNGNL